MMLLTIITEKNIQAILILFLQELSLAIFLFKSQLNLSNCTSANEGNASEFKIENAPSLWEDIKALKLSIPNDHFFDNWNSQIFYNVINFPSDVDRRDSFSVRSAHLNVLSSMREEQQLDEFENECNEMKELLKQSNIDDNMKEKILSIVNSNNVLFVMRESRVTISEIRQCVGVPQVLKKEVGQPDYQQRQQHNGSRVQQPIGSRLQQPIGSRLQQPIESGLQQPIESRVQQPSRSHMPQPIGLRFQQLIEKQVEKLSRKLKDNELD